jgi:hypothetical protein
MPTHSSMSEEERQQDSDIRQSRTTANISATETLEQQGKIRIPPSVSKSIKRRPEFAGVIQRNQSITTNDLMAYYFLFLEQKAGFTNFRVIENIDTTVDVIDSQTGVRVATAPAKYVEMTYLDSRGIPTDGDIALLVLNSDGNTGYALLPVASVLPAPGQLPPEHQMVFDNFELMATNSTITNSTTMSSQTQSPFSQQLQLDQQIQPPL